MISKPTRWISNISSLVIVPYLRGRFPLWVLMKNPFLSSLRLNRQLQRCYSHWGRSWSQSVRTQAVAMCYNLIREHISSVCVPTRSESVTNWAACYSRMRCLTSSRHFWVLPGCSFCVFNLLECWKHSAVTPPFHSYEGFKNPSPIRMIA